MFQVTCNPVPKSDTPSTSAQEVQRSLKRTARMTPLWRIMGTKPHGAYCQNNYECSTAICRWMHFVIKYFCPANNTFNHICQTRNVRTDPQVLFCSTEKATVPTANRFIPKMKTPSFSDLTFSHHHAWRELDSVSNRRQPNVQCS